MIVDCILEIIESSVEPGKKIRAIKEVLSYRSPAAAIAVRFDPAGRDLDTSLRWHASPLEGVYAEIHASPRDPII